MLAGLYWAASRWGLLGAAAANLIIGALLSFNLIVHQSYGGGWRDFLISLGRLTVIPVTALAVADAPGLGLIARLIASVILLTVVAVALWRDVEIRERARHALRPFAGGHHVA